MTGYSLLVSCVLAPLGGAAAPVMVEPRLRWRRRGGDGGVLDGHEPELGGNSTLKREPNYELVDSSSRRVEPRVVSRSVRSGPTLASHAAI